MRENFVAGVGERAALPGVTAPVTPGSGGEHTVGAGYLTVDAARLLAGGAHEVLLEECFGPVTVVVRYADQHEAAGVLGLLGGNLSATLQLSTAETGARPDRPAN